MYKRNALPHDRNAAVFENVHELAYESGLSAKEGHLSNNYYYPELLCDGIKLHLKHFSRHEPISKQIAGARYRQEQTIQNVSFGQLPLPLFSDSTEFPQEAYVIIFFEDSPGRKSEVSDVYFVLPSSEDGNIIAQCSLEEVEAELMVGLDRDLPAAENDHIDLPPQIEEGDQETGGL